MPPTRSTSPTRLKDLLLKSKFIIEEETVDNWCLYRDLDEVMITLSRHGERVPLEIKERILLDAKISDEIYLDYLHQFPEEESYPSPRKKP